MKRVLSLLLLMSLHVLNGAAAGAVTLHHNDLVGIGGEGIVRIDGSTGHREIISTAVAAKDIAVGYGGREVFAVTDDALYSIDPVTGSGTVLASGFGSLGGVAVNRLGEVFVADNIVAPYSSPGFRPQVFKVDPGSGVRTLVMESSLPDSGSAGSGGWFVEDLEIVNDGYLVALGMNSYGSAGPFGCCETAGVVGFDITLDSEDVLFDSNGIQSEFGRSWISVNGLGVLPGGEIVSTGDHNYNANTYGYDRDTGVVREVGYAYSLRNGVGETVAGLWDLDLAATQDGRMFVSHSGYSAFQGHTGERYEGVHLFDPGSGSSVLVDGEAFSPGSMLSEIQAVVIPEPSTALLLGVGLALCSRARRERRV